MGETPNYYPLDDIPGPSSYSLAPFAADIDTNVTGSVKYTQFIMYAFTQMNTVSSFIRSKTGNSFSGTRMMVAEWYNVLSPSFLPKHFIKIWKWKCQGVHICISYNTPSSDMARAYIRMTPEGGVRRAGGDGGAGRAFALPLFGGPYRK